VNSSYWKNSKWIVLGSCCCFEAAVDMAESLDAQQQKSKSCLNPQKSDQPTSHQINNNSTTPGQ
jgi:hypothetical protein